MSHRKPYINPHKYKKRLKKLCRESSLSSERVRQLIDYFNFVTTNPPGKMLRNQFRAEMQELFNLCDDFMVDNVYRCFDQKNHGYLVVNEYVRGMGMFLSDNLDLKTRLCFQVYDLNGDGYITREEMLQWLKGSLAKQAHEEDSDESIKELIDIVMRKLDVVDHDNRVSFKDFTEAVHEDCLLLESLGTCLPGAERKASFLMLISGDIKLSLSATIPNMSPARG